MQAGGPGWWARRGYGSMPGFELKLGVTMSADKGLKKDAISFLSNVTFGISSTSPAYSIAASL